MPRRLTAGVSQTWRFGGRGFHDPLGNNLGTVGCLHDLLHDCAGPRARRDVCVQAPIRKHHVLVERGAGICRLDQANSNAERPHLVIERLRIAFESMLRGGVDGRERGRYQTEDRAYVHDPSRFLIPHDREDRVGRTDHAEKVYVEQRLGLAHRRFFSSGKQAGSSVVHQNVDPARRIEHLVDDRLD